MKKFKGFLADIGVEEDLMSVLESMCDCVREISAVVKFSDTEKAETKNVFGEQQMQLDLVSESIIQRELKKNGHVGMIASEELPDQMKLNDGDFAVCYDPLDGSSLIDVNLSVGTIFGVYKAGNFLGLTGRKQFAAMAAVYGPRTSIVLTVGKGTHEFIMDYNGDFVLSHEKLKVNEGKMFAPGNLRAVVERKDYMKLMEYWCENQYTLRYSGGMVPDVNQILLKGCGIFAYPGYGEWKDGKLRLLFECAPMAFLMEQAGGDASDGRLKILDKPVESVDQRTPIFIGSVGEVKRCEEYLS